MPDPILDIKALVTTRETSKRLHDAGFPCRTRYLYVDKWRGYRLLPCGDLRGESFSAPDIVLPAPTAGELGALLPRIVCNKGECYGLEFERPSVVSWWCGYSSRDDMLCDSYSRTEAEARALLWLALHEKDLLPPETYGVAQAEVAQ